MIEDFVNDLQARLHDVDMIVKKQKNENEFLKKNMNTTVKNMILISLLYGSLDSEKLSKVTGIKSDELGVFLDNMVEDNKIKKENGSYGLVKKEMENAQEQTGCIAFFFRKEDECGGALKISQGQGR